MKKNYHKAIFLAICLIGVVSLAGCDMFSSIKEYFSSKESSSSQSPSAPKESSQKISQPTAPKAPASKREKQGPMPANMLARVGNWSITAEALQARILAEKEQNPEADVDVNNLELRKAILDVLVRQQLLVMDAEEKGLDKKQEVIDAINEVRRTLLVQENVAQIIGDVQVTEKEAKDIYDTVDSPYFFTPLEVRLREIVVDSQVKATELLLEIQKGADFAEIAKTHSKGATAAQGGEMGFITEPPFPEMGTIVLALLDEEGNNVSSSFKGPDGFYIIKIEETRGGEKRPFEELKEFIIGQLTVEKRDALLLEYVAELEKKYTVELNEGLLKQEKN